MDADLENLIVAGCRGSMCVSGDSYRRFGGNTTCFYAQVEPDHYLVVDAGTGLRRLDHALPDRPVRISLFMTHYHWDHTQGLPMFTRIWIPGNEVTIYGREFGDYDLPALIGGGMRQPWWPVSLDDTLADVKYEVLGDGPVEVGSVTVEHAELHHPGGSTGYRLTRERSIVIATDHESGDPGGDERLLSLATGADVLIHDGQYTPEEHQGPKAGWGHSSWESAAKAASDAGVEHLVLTSHDPDRTDDGVDAMRSAARSRFARTDAAYEGMAIPL